MRHVRETARTLQACDEQTQLRMAYEVLRNSSAQFIMHFAEAFCALNCGNPAPDECLHLAAKNMERVQANV